MPEHLLEGVETIYRRGRGLIGPLAVLTSEREVRRPAFEPRPEDRAWIIDRGVREGDVDPELAQAAFRNAQLYLRAIADNPGAVLSPSKLVDAMWHGYMLRPLAYWEACAEAGVFIDHIPNGPDGPSPNALSPSATYQFLLEHGYEPDASVWPAGAIADCENHCNSGDCESFTLPANEASKCGGQSCYAGDCSSSRMPFGLLTPVDRIPEVTNAVPLPGL
jgi:hypothetical protein